MRFKRLVVVCTLFFSAQVAVSASAATIDFDGSSSTLTTYSEYGYNVTAISGTWYAGGGFGNPGPSAIATRPGGTLAFTSGTGGTFNFDSADLATAVTGASVTYDFVGYLGGTQIFSQTGTDTTEWFATFASLYSNVWIDTLDITLSSTTSGAFNVDNVVLTAAAPEPSGILLLGTGLMGVAGLLRRRLA